MKKTTRKILSLVLALVMIISIVPLSALAEGEEGQVGLVVYGADITELVAGDASLESLADMAQEFVAEGITVPSVKVKLTNKKTGKEYWLQEDRNISLFDTLDFQSDAYDFAKDTVQAYINLVLSYVEKIPLGGKTVAELARKTIGTATDYTSKATDAVDDVLKDVSADFENLIALNGSAYRIYKSDKIPVGEYTVYIEEFDKDADTIRAGYILYDDEDSTFYCPRTFDITVEEQTKDGQLQYIGNDQNSMGMGVDFSDITGIFTGPVNTIISAAEALDKADVLNLGIMDPFILSMKTINKALTLEYGFSFTFPGLYTQESKAGFTFQNTDIINNPLAATADTAGASFVMVNRDEVVDILDFMIGLGKDTFNALKTAAFGGENADGTEDYESLVKLHTQLINTDDGQMSLDFDVAKQIIKTYVGIIADMNIYDRVVNSGLKIPAVLTATADENGLVTFNRSCNVTLVWALEFIPMIMDMYQALGLTDQLTGAFGSIVKYAEKLGIDLIEGSADLTGDVINTTIYPFAQRMGFVGPKFNDGNYVMFQYKAPTGYLLNPMAYTMKVEWINKTWLYTTVANLGIIMPYFNEAFYDFVRGTTYAAQVDKFLGKVTQQEDFDLISRILSNQVDITDAANQKVTATLTAFAAKIGFESLGGSKLFTSVGDLVKDMNQYLYNQGRSTQNLMIYLNGLALKAKDVYAGDLTPTAIKNEAGEVIGYTYWQFYNLDLSPITTFNKVIETSTASIADCMVSDKQKTVVTKTGTTVQKVVNNVSTKVQETAAKYGETVKTTAKAVAVKVASVAKSTVSSLTSKILSIFSKKTTSN